MTVRRRHTRKDRERILSAAGNLCHLCGGTIQPGDAWDIEHVIALELSGDDTDANKRPAHRKCHVAKTRDDVAKIAKAKRQEAGHRGFSRPKQTIHSRGFDRKERPEKLPQLPPRAIYRSTE